MTLALSTGKVVSEPLWFGPVGRPLFGWLSRPADGTARGGVLLAPPIGRESRAAHRAYRRLAEDLAARGFAALRFDYDGTGDSSGAMSDAGRDTAWLDSVEAAADLLRSIGLSEISGVGMRFGATLLGVAAARVELKLSSVVLWDPCESGRSFLRELAALESLRRAGFTQPADGSVETTEFVFTAQTATEMRSISLSAYAHVPLAERVLIMSRRARPLPAKLQKPLDQIGVEWQITEEQERFIDTEPLDAVLPTDSMGKIVDWLAQSEACFVTMDEVRGDGVAVIVNSGTTVRERAVRLGRNNLFGIVTEPTGEAHGPWIIALNVGNENHIGPSRQWVELSRRWAAHGLRCLRFDLVGLGDSPLLDGLHETTWYDRAWLDDVPDAVRTVADDPSDVVLVGLCSGAYAALEAALQLNARGVCAVNPILDIDFLQRHARLGDERRRAVRSMPAPLQKLAVRHQRPARYLWRLCRELRPSGDPVDVLAKLVRGGADLLVFGSPDDMDVFGRVWFWRRFGLPKLAATGRFTMRTIEDLDHGMHIEVGRRKAVQLLDRHVLTRFGGQAGMGEESS